MRLGERHRVVNAGPLVEAASFEKSCSTADAAFDEGTTSIYHIRPSKVMRQRDLVTLCCAMDEDYCALEPRLSYRATPRPLFIAVRISAPTTDTLE